MSAARASPIAGVARTYARQQRRSLGSSSSLVTLQSSYVATYTTARSKQSNQCLQCEAFTSTSYLTATLASRPASTARNVRRLLPVQEDLSNVGVLVSRRGFHTVRRLRQEVARPNQTDQKLAGRSPSSSSISSGQLIQHPDDEPYKPPDATSSSSKEVSDNPSKDKVPRNAADVSIGEIRRLFTLARPEKRTLSIALGLVSCI